MAECWQGGKGKLCLPGPLKEMQFHDSDIFSLHEGFPLSNLLGLTRLVLSTSDYREEGTEEALFKGLPLITPTVTGLIYHQGLLDRQLCTSCQFARDQAFLLGYKRCDLTVRQQPSPQTATASCC